MKPLRLRMDDFNNDRDSLPFPVGGVFGCRGDGPAQTHDDVIRVLDFADRKLSSLSEQLENIFTTPDDDSWHPTAA